MLSRQAEAVVLVVVAAAVEDSAVQVEVVADSAVVEAVVAQTEGESSFLFSCVCWRIWCAKKVLLVFCVTSSYFPLSNHV